MQNQAPGSGFNTGLLIPVSALFQPAGAVRLAINGNSSNESKTLLKTE